jgi:protein-L-isoaspartate(D-aspartate) O-methyltransferase
MAHRIESRTPEADERCRVVNKGGPAVKPMGEEHLAVLRRHMVEVIAIQFDLMADEIGKEKVSERVAEAMRRVRRHLFVPAPLASIAYQDSPLPIGFDKTISQPFISALMTDLLNPLPQNSVLEIGTGLGYQAAVLAELARQVWSVEVVEEFASFAEDRLRALGYGNVAVRVGDGSKGWAEHAPFDRVLVTAAAKNPPRALLGQLKPGGRLVMPLGPDDAQSLTVINKTADGRIETRGTIPVRFSRLETGV